jgi:Spy/CpxP family protein refolding chaperone
LFATAAIAEPTTQPAKAGKPAPSLIKGYYAMMANEVELTEAQRTKLEAVLAARQAELVAFQKEHGDELKALGEKLKAAKEADDTDAIKSISADIRKINSGKGPIEEAYKPKIAAVLTPEQTTKLESYHLYTGLATHYGKANLTSDQKAKLRELATKHVSAVQKIGDDKKARAAVLKTIYAEADSKILTEEQLAAMKAPKK